MIIRDALYGAFELPSFLDELVMAPEFRRLSEVRLININSATLSSLADVRRYSHTLGVLRLALENPLTNLGKDELRAFLAAIIVHDAGTPAFAHLFEYFLQDRYSVTHESVLPNLLKKTHHPDARAHQIYGSKSPQFERLCGRAKIDFSLVLSILDGRHPASRLLFGTVDFDNIDNVARMNWMLGVNVQIDRILELASELGVGGRGQILLPISQQPNLEMWATLRRQAYEVLVFDEPTVAGQAVLASAIAEALADGTLAELDWYYADSDLLRAISAGSKPGKEKLDRDFFGELPSLVALAQIRDPSHPALKMSRGELVKLIETFLKEECGVRHPYGHILRDRGTFEKRTDFVDPNTGVGWGYGTRSDSLILYGFGKPRHRPAAQETGNELLEWMSARL